ncbi:MAG: hypothetical protein JJU02_16745 [Cryomorphaceae bacterium]|nr:hypothetical protein [Cryomorphaceae bacterium]
MKNRFVILSLLFPFFAMAQEVAVTERGDSVVLYANGTWDYYDNYISGGEEIPEIPLNDKAFNKPENAGKKINGANNFYQVWYNEKSWKRIPPRRP